MLEVLELHPKLKNHAILLDNECYQLRYIAQNEQKGQKEIVFGEKFNDGYYNEQCKNYCSHFKYYSQIEEEHLKTYSNMCLLHPSLFVEILDHVLKSDYQSYKLLRCCFGSSYGAQSRRKAEYVELLYWKAGVFTSKQLLEQYPETFNKLTNGFFGDFLHTDSYYDKFIKTLTDLKVACKFCTGKNDTVCYKNEVFKPLKKTIEHPDIRWYYNAEDGEHVVYDVSHSRPHNFNFVNVYSDGRICFHGLDRSIHSPKDLINQFWLSGANADLWDTNSRDLLYDLDYVEDRDDAEDFEPTYPQLLRIIPVMSQYSAQIDSYDLVDKNCVKRDLPDDVVAVILAKEDHAEELINEDIGNFEITEDEDGDIEQSYNNAVILYAVEKTNNVYKVYAPNLEDESLGVPNYFFIDITK